LGFRLGIEIYRPVSEFIGPLTFLRLLPAVMVLKTYDIVLAEVAAGLHLDNMQRDFPDVFEPVNGGERNISRLVLGQDKLLVIAHDLRRPLHDDPVLGAMVMLL
jgi:hypothetical protein